MLAILTTHPIQYQVPLWRLLAQESKVPLEVWYLTEHAVRPSRDREFGRTFAWDLDMLSGYPHRFLNTPPTATPNQFWQCRIRESLSERMREQKITALWIQGWQVAGYWQAVRAAKRAGVQVWLRGESNNLRPPPPFPKRVIKHALLSWLFSQVDCFLCIGKANRDLYRSFGVPDSKLHHAPYAVDNARFARQAAALRPQRSEIRREWKIPDDAFCILFCGKFIQKKRPLDVVRAAEVLQMQVGAPKVHLLFAGSGELGGELRGKCSVVFDAEADQLPITRERSTLPPASFAGFLNQTKVSKAYVAADCLVLPSDYEETWGLVVNEAMASGLPCVIGDHCGCAEDLGKVPPNVVFRYSDLNALADAIRQLFESVERLARATDMGDFSFEQTLATVQALYSQIALRSDRRR